MSTIKSRIKEGNFQITGEVNERLPKITNGLIAHFPLDGAGGTFDTVGGFQPIQHTTGKLNLFDAMNLDWRNPDNWISFGSDGNIAWDESKQALKFKGNGYFRLRTPIVVDTNKHYYITCEFMAENNEPLGENATRLYLGGYGVDSTGTMYTTNYDYSIRAGDQTPYNNLGTWYTFSRTRYGTGSYYSGADCGWTSNTLCYKYYFGGLFNYYGSANSVCYLRNISIVVTDADTSNVTYNLDSVAVEGAITNILSSDNATLSEANTWGCYDGIDRPYHTWDRHISRTFVKNGYKQGSNSYILTKYTIGNVGMCLWSGLAAQSEGTVTTFSYKARAREGGVGSMIQAQRYTQNSTLGIASDATIYTLTDEWQNISHTWTARAGDGTTNIYMFNTRYIGSFEVAEPQVTLSTIPYSWVNGKKSAGILSLPNRIITSNTWSIDFEATVGKIYETWRMFFGAWPYFYFGIYPSGNYPVFSYVNGTQQSLSYSGWEVNVIGTHKYCLTYDGSNLKLYQDGILKRTISSVSLVFSNFSGLNFNVGTVNASYPANGVTQKSYSFYNRVLSDAEVQSLHGASIRMKSDGNFDSITVKEKPIIPADCYYLPLMENARDIYGVITPSSEANTVFTKDGVWVGSLTTNLYNNFAPFTVAGSNTDVSTSLTERGFLYSQGAKTYKFEKDGLVNEWNGWEGAYGGIFDGVSGTYYTSSGYYKTNSSILPSFHDFNCMSTDISTIVSNDQLTACTDKIIIPNGKWNPYCLTTKFNQTYNNSVGVDPLSWGYSTSAGTLYVHAMMWENKPFPSPFCVGTRGDSELEYNLNSSIGLDWNGNWSIVYWKKPLGTYNNTFTGYNLESLGCNSNSVGGGYLYWGKMNAANTVGLNGTAFYTFTNYFNKWNMISLVKSGTSLTVKVWGIDGTIQSSSVGIGTIVSNYFVTQHGYDFKLGGWDNASPGNSYYKDLVVAKRALTDTELNAMYQVRMRSYKSGRLYIQGELMEVPSLT